jgi:hypothetical protein
MSVRVVWPHGVRDELPEEVLIELGRFTWAAILLEDLTDSLCAFIH